MRTFRKLMVFLIAVSMLFSVASAAESFSIEAFLAEQSKDYIAQYYKFGVTEEELYQKVLNAVLTENPELIDTVMEAMLEGLDEHSEYLTDEQFHSFSDSIEGTFVGIGVTIEELDGYIKVIAPIKDSPAEMAGIVSGDRIVSVNGENIVGKGIEYTQSLILGAEGTPVDVGILREGSETEIVYTIIRAFVKQTTVYPSVIEGDTGYLQITQFSTSTPADTKTALKDFDTKGIKKLIIDMRNNPGGDKNALVEMLRLFMPKGAVFRVNYKDESLDEVYYATKRPDYNYDDIVILINENSASAAEAFAGSMQDAGHTVVGMTSYGKGTVQMIMPTIIGSAIKLTVATYKTAKGREINKVGVLPDAMIKNKTVRLDDNPDVEKVSYSIEITADSDAAAIKAMQQRLYALKYYRGDTDGIFTEELTKSVNQFQNAHGLKATGRLDIMTQVEIANLSADLETTADYQLSAALDILKTGVIPEELKTK